MLNSTSPPRLEQLGRRERRRGARVARRGRPRVLGDHGAAAGLLHGVVEQRRVERAERLAGVVDHLEVGGDEHVRVVGDLVARGLRRGRTREVLLAVGVEQPEAHRQAEVLRLVVEAQRRERGDALLVGLHLLHVDLGDEELHLLLHVRSERGRGALGDLVFVVVQPGLEAIGLLGAEDDDLVFTDGELGLDLDAVVGGRPSAPGRFMGAIGFVGEPASRRASAYEQGSCSQYSTRRGAVSCSSRSKTLFCSVFTFSFWRTTGTGTTIAKSAAGPL